MAIVTGKLLKRTHRYHSNGKIYYRSYDSFETRRSLTSSSSPRSNGHLVLRNNPLDDDRHTVRIGLAEYTIQPNFPLKTEIYSVQYPSTPPWFPYSFPSSGPSYSAFAPLRDQVRYKALMKFFLQLNEQKMNVAEMYRTRTQTLSMIADRATRLANFYRDLRKGRNPWKNGSRVNPKNASSLWLENIYGWQPLVSDVFAAMELEKLEPPPIYHKVRSSGTMTLPPSVKILNIDNGTSQKAIITTTTTNVGRANVTVSARVHVTDISRAFLQTLGLQNPALLAWELLPYSFVVDWFLPVGPWLQAQEALIGLSLSEYSTTTTMRQTYFGESTVKSGTLLNRVSTTSKGHISGFAKRKFRSTSPFSVPSFPRIKNPVSPIHAINAIALLGTVFGRKSS